ncbi:cation channel sperm-associated auxiliary subunit beta-like [Rhinoraja longicauda]
MEDETRKNPRGNNRVVFASIYLFVTKSAFTSVNDKWYDIKPAICSLIQGVCNVKLLDIILTNRHLVIFTNLGLFMSEDMLFQPGKDLQDEIYRILLWHTEECFAQKIDVMGLSGSIVNCFFEAKGNHSLLNSNIHLRVHTCYIVVMASGTAEYLSITADVPHGNIKVAITVWKCDKDFNIIGMKAFQQFYFPDLEFFPTGLFVYPTMYYLYAYGSQVWYSMDGGNSFNLLIKLKVGHVIKAFACPRFNAVIFITNNNIIYYTRPGMARYALFDNWEKEKLAFSCDHYGALMKISVDISGVTGLKVQFIDHQSLIAADDAGFLRPLALQYLTSVKVIVFEHASWIEDPQGVQPMFSPTHVGKLLKLRFAQAFYDHLGFLFVVVWMYRHSNSRNRQLTHLCYELPKEVVEIETVVTFRRHLNKYMEYGFIADDFEKTVVIPGLSSFLIVRINSSNLVIAHATMPELVSDYLLIEEKKWFIYDFSSKSGVWAIVENECTTQIEDLDNIQLNSEMFLDINDTVKLRFKSSSFKGGNAQRFKVSIGNPHLLRIETENYWDDSGIASLNLVIYSNFNVREEIQFRTKVISDAIGKSLPSRPQTNLSVVSCPAGKMILYKEPISISRDEWLYGNPKDDETDSPLLKTLPVNYRPPSPQGINVPLSENIYNADPSKPRFRDFYKISKETGIYKQCVAKKSREECGCTEEMMLSSFAEFSDCKQRVEYPDEEFNKLLRCFESSSLCESIPGKCFYLKVKLQTVTYLHDDRL